MPCSLAGCRPAASTLWQGGPGTGKTVVADQMCLPHSRRGPRNRRRAVARPRRISLHPVRRTHHRWARRRSEAAAALPGDPEHSIVKTILVVDDEADIAQTLQAFIELHGYGVVLAYDGVEALRKVLEEPPDLIIT